MKKSLGFDFSRSALEEIVEAEIGNMIRDTVKALIRKEVERKLERVVREAVWGPLEDARKAHYRAQKRKEKRSLAKVESTRDSALTGAKRR